MCSGITIKSLLLVSQVAAALAIIAALIFVGGKFAHQNHIIKTPIDWSEHS